MHQAVNVFLEDLLIADILSQVSILLLDLHQIGKGQRVDELASLAVWALEVLVILLAELGLVSGGDVLLLLKFMVTMSECASISVLASLVLDPTFAEFCLDLQLVVVRNDSAVTSESKRIARGLLVFLWDPGLLDVVAPEELVLVLKLVFDASDLTVEVA